MKQTAVEWLYQKILLTPLDIRSINKCLEQAKEMEKEQIIEAWNIRAKIDGVLTYTDNRTAEQYYNETYESKTNI
jgi:hypothetical protein